MNSNLDIWARLSDIPPSAMKTIQAGRLKGKSDINPQARYKVMTQEFGPCGVGWKFEIKRLWTEPGDGGEIFAFCEVLLHVKVGEQWSEPIPGVGGHKLIESERAGLHNNDEAYKMCITDALGTAMKMLGVAAEVYLGNFDGSKYRTQHAPPADTGKDYPPNRRSGVRHPTEKQMKRLYAIGKSHGWNEDVIHAYAKKEWGTRHLKELSLEHYKLLCGEPEEGIVGILEGTPPKVISEQERYDARARQLIAEATEWISFKATVTKIATGYVEKQLDFANVGADAAEKMMFLVGAAIEAGDDPGVLRAHVDSWSHFSADQRKQLRTSLDAMAETA